MKYLILAALLFVAHSSFCQDTVKLKNHIITYQSFPTDDEKEVFVRYKIWKKNYAHPVLTLIQEVSASELKHTLESEYHNYSPVLIEDWNFDGYEDIGLMKGSGSYTVYLYDTVKQEFIQNTQLTDLYYAYSSHGTLSILRKKQLIGAYDRNIAHLYVWEDNNLVLVMESYYDRVGSINEDTKIYADQVAIDYYSSQGNWFYVINIIHNDKILFSKEIDDKDDFAEALRNIWITEED